MLHTLSSPRYGPFTPVRTRWSVRFPGQTLHEQVIEVDSIVEIFYPNPLVAPVCPVVVHVFKYARHSIGGNTTKPQIFSVRCAGINYRNHRNSAIELRAQLFQLAHDHRIEG